MPELIYMDHAGTTKPDPAVVEAMMPYFGPRFGNASTLYSLGTQAREAVEVARGQVASLIGARPQHVFFTGSGTEADNWALVGVPHALAGKGDHIITTPIEHSAIMSSCRFLEKHGFRVTYIPVDRYGLVDPDDLARALTDKTVLVSVMAANNEVGTIEPVQEIAKICRASGVYFHTDAVQAVGGIPVNVEEIGCDLLSVSAHKLYGPKGVGALYIRPRTKIVPFMHGGGQEGGRRAGTENVPGIVGMGKACELAAERMEEQSPRIAALRDRLRDGIFARIDHMRLTGHPSRRLPNSLSVAVEWVEGESVLLMLDAEGICVTSGSACTSGSLEPSHVLKAIGVPIEVAHGSVRFTLGNDNTEQQIDHVIEVFERVIRRVREMSPTYRQARAAGVAGS
jgi:cysteine desulfurase